MSIQVYRCPHGHTTERSVNTTTHGPPAYIRCPHHHGSTHSENCAQWHECRRRAKYVISAPQTILTGEGFTGAGKDMHTR